MNREYVLLAVGAGRASVGLVLILRMVLLLCLHGTPGGVEANRFPDSSNSLLLPGLRG